MARPLKPFVRGGGYYPSRKWTPLVYNGGYTTKRDGSTPPTPEYWKTITGISPLALVNSLAKPLRSLTRFGKCTQPPVTMYSTITQQGKLVQDGTPTPTAPVDIVCNNGPLRVDVNGEVYGNDPETLTIGNQTVRVADLLAIGSYKDALEIVSSVKTKRIRARVLTGSADEGWFKSSGRNVFSASTFFSDMIVRKALMYCTHFGYSDDASTSVADLCFGSANTSTNTFFRYDAISTLEGWRTFLAEQLAAGTPVIIVYVLAEETTEQLAPADIDLTYKPITVTTAVGDVTITETHAAVSTPSPRTPLPIWCNNGVLRANVSILDPTNIYGNYLLKDNGTIGSAAANFYLTNFIPVRPSTSYTFTFRSGADAQYRRLAEYTSDDEDTFVNLAIKMPKPTAVDDVITRTFVTSPTTNYIRLSSSALDTEQSIRLTDYALNEVYADGTPEVLTIGGGSLVPDGYTELKTVQNANYNNQGVYVDTGVTLTSLLNTKLTVKNLRAVGTMPRWTPSMGAGGISSDYSSSYGIFGSRTGLVYGVGGNRESANVAFDSDYHDVALEIDGSGNVSLSVDGTAQEIPVTTAVDITGNSIPITIIGNAAFPAWPGDIGRVTLEQNGVVLFDCVPTERDSDDVVGFYDVTASAFRVQSGGDPITAGDPAPASGQTVSVETLLAVEDYTDSHELIAGDVERACAAVVYDGTQTIGDVFLSETGGKDIGSIIVYPLATPTTESVTPQPVDGIDGTTTITSSSPVEARMRVVYESSEE